MASKPKYRLLSGYPPDHATPTIYEKEEGCAECESHCLRNQKHMLHWMAHAGSLFAIISLLALLLHAHNGSDLAMKCWDMHNYYCEGGTDATLCYVDH